MIVYDFETDLKLSLKLIQLELICDLYDIVRSVGNCNGNSVVTR